MENQTYIIILPILVLAFILFYSPHYAIIKTRTYIINLKRRPDRLETILNQIQIEPNLLHITEAVDARSLDTQPYAHLKIEANVGTGPIACYLSHFQIWNMVAILQDDYGLVLEDDVKLEGEDPQKDIDRCVLKAPLDWDIIFLGANMFAEASKIDACFTKPNEGMFGAHAYLISKRGARKLIEATITGGITMPVDIFMTNFEACKCNFYLLNSNNLHPRNIGDSDTVKG